MIDPTPLDIAVGARRAVIILDLIDDLLFHSDQQREGLLLAMFDQVADAIMSCGVGPEALCERVHAVALATSEQQVWGT